MLRGPWFEASDLREVAVVTKAHSLLLVVDYYSHGTIKLSSNEYATVIIRPMLMRFRSRRIAKVSLQFRL